MDTFDTFLRNKIQNDKVDLNLENARFNHLHYLVNLNATRSNVKQNSIFGFIADFLSPRFVAVKLAFVAVLLIWVLGNKENRVHQNFIFLCDSTIIHNNSYDSLTNCNKQLSDSLFN